MKVGIRSFVLGGVALLSALPLHAQTQQSQPRPPILNPVTKRLHGTLIPAHPLEADPSLTVPDSCRFTFSLKPGEKAIEGRRVSDVDINQSDGTCDAVFEIGEPSAEEQSPPGSTRLERSTKSTPPIRTGQLNNGRIVESPAGLPGAAPLVESAGFLKSFFLEPLGAEVNSVQNATDWVWQGAGTCVTEVFEAESLAWLTLTGWELLADNFATPITCQQTTSSSTTLYGNIPFCFFDVTFTAYQPNQVNGQWDGTLVGFFNDSAFGSFCSSFLTNGFVFARTLN